MYIKVVVPANRLKVNHNNLLTRAGAINVYIKVVVPANRLKVNHNNFVALHSIGKFSEGLRVLVRVE